MGEQEGGGRGAGELGPADLAEVEGRPDRGEGAADGEAHHERAAQPVEGEVVQGREGVEVDDLRQVGEQPALCRSEG